MRLLFICLLFPFVFQSCKSAAEAPPTVTDKAKALVASQHFYEALQLINPALKTDSANIHLLELKSTCEFALRHYHEAIAALDRALKIAPHNTSLYCDRGVMCASMGMNDTSIANFNSALQYATTDSERRFIYTNLGVSYMQKQDFATAYGRFMQAYQLDSNDMAVLIDLGAVCTKAGHAVETLHYLQRAVALDPANDGPLINIGYMYQEQGNYAEAMGYYAKAMALKKDNPLAFSNKAYCELKTGHAVEALKDVNHSLELNPSNSFAYKIKALIELALGDKENACNDLYTAEEQGYNETYGDEVKQLLQKHCKGK